MLPPDRQVVLNCTAKVRLITGKPGVGKTYFGCQIAKHAISHQDEIGPQHRVLFLTYARNAVARIRQSLFAPVGADETPSATYENQGRSELQNRIRLNTFHGFFWWLVECYGRYAQGGSRERPWLLGSRRIADDVPPGYRGYTFDEIVDLAHNTMEVKAVRDLVSSLYPLVVIDEFQDVEPTLFSVVALLGKESRLVLLSGPGQTIYRSLKAFNPEEVMQRCEQELQPERFDIGPVAPDKQRFCHAIAAFVNDFEREAIAAPHAWPIMLKSIPKLNKNGNPNQLGTQAGVWLKEMEIYLRRTRPHDVHNTIAVLTSTNDAVAEISQRIIAGNELYRFPARRASVCSDDTVLLQYGRFLLELLQGHWISGRKKASSNEGAVATRLTVLFQEHDRETDYKIEEWVNWSKYIGKKVERCQQPSELLAWRKRLEDNLEKVNYYLRATKEDMARDLCLPRAVAASGPSTAFTAAQKDLLTAMARDFIGIIIPTVADGALNIPVAREVFERAMQQRVIFEKIGLEPRVQIMTIHKAKGREFDGVVLVLENNHKALWKASRRIDEEERLDLYRVAITRARHAFALVAFEDAYSAAASVVQRLLPQPSFLHEATSL